MQNWRLAPACRNFFYRFDLAILHQQRTIEIVHRGANMPRKEMKRFTDLWPRCSCLYRHWQMLLTG